MDIPKNNLDKIKKISFFILPFLLVIALFSTRDKTYEQESSSDSSICHGSRSRPVLPITESETSASNEIQQQPTEDIEAIGTEQEKIGSPSINTAHAEETVNKAEALGTETQQESAESAATQVTATIASVAGVLGAQQTATAKAAALVDNGFGIAAGGDLVYWKQEDLNKYFQELKNLGVTWVRWDIDWQVVQPYSLQDYHWEGTDRIADTARRYGIKSLGIITYSPQWAQDSICPRGKQCPPESPEMFVYFAGKVAERYKGKVDAFEIWNEPNYNLYWYPSPNADDYAELLKQSYVRIKEVDPDAIVVSAGLTDMGDEDDVSVSPLSFVNTLYESGAKDYFDVLALHPYTYPGYNYAWPQITSVLKVMKDNGDSAKKLWVTEYGAPTGGPGRAYGIGEKGFSYGKDFMTEEAQKTMAVDIFKFQAENSDRIGNVFWYSLCDNNDNSSTPENFFGILRYDGTRKPVYEILKKLFS